MMPTTAPRDVAVHPALLTRTTRMPRVLLLATVPWPFAARLAGALRLAGFHVEAVCRHNHPLRDLSEPPPAHHLAWVLESGSVAAAIDRAAPDLVIPCDDPAVVILHRLHRRNPASRLSALIERSLGREAGFQVAERRTALIELARAMGLLVPRSEVLAGPQTLAAVRDRISYPCVLKRDGTWSGTGVKVVHSDAELSAAWSAITGWTSVLRAGAAALRDRRPRALIDVFLSETPSLELQEFLPGTPANRAVLCSNGEVLAGISVRAEQTLYPGGPASVVRIIDNREMEETARALAARLGLSGLCGFDFVISPEGRAYLIELNPRATPICHLALANGTHLPAALYREMTGNEPVRTAEPIPGDLVALFPTEWLRDPSSPFLGRAHHDAPWDEPALLQRFGLSRRA